MIEIWNQNNWDKEMNSQEKVQQGLGLGQNVGVTKSYVWKIFDQSNGRLVTTSGRLNTLTLNDTIDAVKVEYPTRIADYSFVFNGTVQSVLKPDDTVESVP